MPDSPADTIIGANVELTGSLHNHGAITVHGKVTGDIVCDSQVVIGETALVAGPISAKQVDISGQVHGSVTAEGLIELQPKSLVKGDLITNRLSIKPGAVFIGKSQMMAAEDEPAQESSEIPMPASEKKRPRAEIQ